MLTVSTHKKSISNFVKTSKKESLQQKQVLMLLKGRLMDRSTMPTTTSMILLRCWRKQSIRLASTTRPRNTLNSESTLMHKIGTLKIPESMSGMVLRINLTATSSSTSTRKSLMNIPWLSTLRIHLPTLISERSRSIL